MEKYGVLIVVSVVMGTLARAVTLKIDYRQYPSYPHGFVTHLTLGFIASALGTLALPALLEGDFVAVTFLALAAQQFREIRSIERQTLVEVEITELVPRGTAYIEGIAKLFEARNFLAMSTAFLVSLMVHYIGLIWGVLGGLVFNLGMHKLMVGPTIGNIATIKETEIVFKGKSIGIENVIMMNIGEDDAVENWKKYGLGFILAPKNDNARATLVNVGQRQAILHEVATQMGIRLDVGIQQYSPLARLDIETGRVCVVIMPIEPDPKAIIQVIKKVPVLESTQRKPLKSKAGKQASD